MTKHITIALDAMGGDHAPAIVVEGAAIAAVRHPHARFLFFGDEARIKPLLDKHAKLKDISEIRHTDQAISGDDKPSNALRNGRQSSMRLAINAVKTGEADCVVSAGNTGALMAMAKFVLRTLPGIDRPAIASFFPTERGETAMLDLGANVDCDVDNLVQFAVMGAVFTRIALGLEKPRIGLLNVGSEELKGHDVVRATSARLKDMHLPGIYHGYVEGDEITKGTVDVIVTDGFSGNIALKTAEGTAKFVAALLKKHLSAGLLAKLGYLLAHGAFKKIKARMDPRRYNGALFLGLGGVCIKSHGGTDAFGFAHAIEVGADLIAGQLNDRIAAELSDMTTSMSISDSSNGDAAVI